MKKLVVMGLAMAITVSMMNGVCAQPVHAAKGKGLKVALLMSGAANDQGWNQTAYEGAQKACDKYGCELAYTENLEAADISAAFADNWLSPDRKGIWRKNGLHLSSASIIFKDI